MTLSARATSTYQNLLAALQAEPAPEIFGNPHKVMRGAKGYWYDMYRLGTAVKNRYLGEDSPELQVRVETFRAQAKAAKSRADARLALIKTLRAEGLASTDRETAATLTAFERSGVFGNGGVLCGTQAFRLYEGLLGQSFADTGAASQSAPEDALSIALPQKVQPFQDLDFIQIPGALSNTTLRWKHAPNGGLVEFLTPSAQIADSIRPIPALGLAAQSRPFLAFLTEAPVDASLIYRAGLSVKIPSPARFALHKLIIAARRKPAPDLAKAHKDRAQAAFLIKALAETPEVLRAAYTKALALPQASAMIATSLAFLPETAAILAPLYPGPKLAAQENPKDTAQGSFDF